MIISLGELIYWIHITPFELAVHLVSLLLSLFLAVLRDEGLLFDQTSEEGRYWAIGSIFIPLWTADAATSYFNLLIFSRRVWYHEVIRKRWLRSGLPHHSLAACLPLSSIVLDRIYALLCCFCFFLFKLLLFQRIVHGNRSNLTYGMVFSPLICVMQLVLLSICLKTCRHQTSTTSTTTH